MSNANTSLEEFLSSVEYSLQEIKKLSVSSEVPFILIDNVGRVKVFNKAACDKYEVDYGEAIDKVVPFINEDDFNKSTISVNIMQADNSIGPTQCTLLIAK